MLVIPWLTAEDASTHFFSSRPTSSWSRVLAEKEGKHHKWKYFTAALSNSSRFFSVQMVIEQPYLFCGISNKCFDPGPLLRMQGAQVIRTFFSLPFALLHPWYEKPYGNLPKVTKALQHYSTCRKLEMHEPQLQFERWVWQIERICCFKLSSSKTKAADMIIRHKMSQNELLVQRLTPKKSSQRTSDSSSFQS